MFEIIATVWILMISTFLIIGFFRYNKSSFFKKIGDFLADTSTFKTGRGAYLGFSAIGLAVSIGALLKVLGIIKNIP